MLGAKIWGIAQLLSALIAIPFSLEIGVLIIPFALVGGLPALLVFNMWLRYMKRNEIKGRQAIASSALVMPTATAACAAILIVFVLLFHSVDDRLLFFALPSIAATLISVLLFNKSILRYLQPDEADNLTNEIAVNENQ